MQLDYQFVFFINAYAYKLNTSRLKETSYIEFSLPSVYVVARHSVIA